MDVFVTNPNGKTCTVSLDQEPGATALCKTLLWLYGGGWSTSQTVAAVEAQHCLRDGKVVEVRGWKFEPVVDAVLAEGFGDESEDERAQRGAVEEVHAELKAGDR